MRLMTLVFAGILPVLSGCAGLEGRQSPTDVSALDVLQTPANPALVFVETVRPASWMGVEYRTRPDWGMVKAALYPDASAGETADPGARPAHVVHFAHDSARLDLRQMAVIADSARGAPRVEVVGHADDTGGADYNLRLGERRARAVQGYLSRQGVLNVGVTSKGEAEPVARGTDAASRARNRRAEIFIVGKGGSNE